MHTAALYTCEADDSVPSAANQFDVMFITAAQKISLQPSPRLNVNIMMRVQNNFTEDSPKYSAKGIKIQSSR